MDEPRIKGAAVRELVLWYGEKYGEKKLERLAARAGEIAGRKPTEPPILELLPSAWYPSRTVNALLDALAEGENEVVLQHLAHDATRAVIARGTGTVYRFLLQKLATPELYARLVPRFWSQLHSTGERTITIVAPGQLESVVRAWPGHHPLLCTITIETMAAIFEAMGLTDVRWRRLACVSKGDAECRTELRWRSRA